MTGSRDWHPLARTGLALALGVLGGWIFYRLTLPLPWMLGAIFFNIVASMLRLPVSGPTRVRRVVSAVIGIMLGSSFTPEIMAHAAGWIASLCMLAVYLAVSALIVVPYYRRIGGMDRVTAYFAGMPGGLNEMTMIGRDMGADDRVIVMAHATRIVIVVMIVAVSVRFLPGYDASLQRGAGAGWSDLPPVDYLLLLFCGVAGFALGRVLRLPAYHILGPMIVSAALHLAGILTLGPPSDLVSIAQLFLGTIIGCRFVGVAPSRIGRSLLLGAGATLIMLAITLVFAAALHALTGQSTVQVLLAFSPGGLAEMSLVALAIEADVAFVALHHLARITLILLAAPILFRIWQPRRGTGEG